MSADFIVYFTVEEGGFGYKFPYDISLEEIFKEMSTPGEKMEIDDPNDVENMAMSDGVAVLAPFKGGLVHSIKVWFTTGYELSIYASIGCVHKVFYQNMGARYRVEHPPMRKELDPVEVLKWVKR